jgi:hypothetical protein
MPTLLTRFYTDQFLPWPERIGAFGVSGPLRLRW